MSFQEEGSLLTKLRKKAHLDTVWDRS
jgi:hypothetical protein